MRERHEDPEYNKNYDGPCSVLIDSAVDMWAGSTLKTNECKVKATHVVFEDDDEDPSYVCQEHARAWVDYGDTWFHEELDTKPVSDAEVQAAIASILGVAS